MRATGGGAFDRNDRFRYFLAGNEGELTDALLSCDYFLIAVNELNNQDDIDWVQTMIDQGKRVLIDSGIFNLTNEHMRSHAESGITMDQALALAPEEIDGFGRLWDRYLDVVHKLEAGCWGYIELDQGGRDNKIRTRARLHALGLNPIPVYHPFNDGWQYFDDLARGYDRICFGNVVQAQRPVRLRLLQTAWERHRAYPHLWIHLLGLTPNEWLNAFPIDSADSSSWLVGKRWSKADRERAGGQTFTPLPLHFRYMLGSDPDTTTGHHTATRRDAWRIAINEMNWHHYLDTISTELGADVLPPPATLNRHRARTPKHPQKG